MFKGHIELKLYLDILGFTEEIWVLPKATREQKIHKQFRTLSATCHPDKFPDNKEKEEQFKQLSNARDKIIEYCNPKYERCSESKEEKLFKSGKVVELREFFENNRYFSKSDDFKNIFFQVADTVEPRLCQNL
jgi:DnaJ-class molecular chaperone